MTATTLE